MPKPRESQGCMFMPFDALSGYQEMIAREKRQNETRHELSEEDKQRIGQILLHLSPGQKLKIKYWDYDRYELLEGNVTELNTLYQIIRVQDIPICFEDIYRIKIIF